jgi:hypothetical protein
LQAHPGPTVLQITLATTWGHPLVARGLAGRASVASAPQSGTIRNARLLRAQRASQFIVGMLAPTSGDSLGTGERSGPRSLGVRAAPIFTSAPGLGKMNIRSLFCDIEPQPQVIETEAHLHCRALCSCRRRDVTGSIKLVDHPSDTVRVVCEIAIGRGSTAGESCRNVMF